MCQKRTGCSKSQCDFFRLVLEIADIYATKYACSDSNLGSEYHEVAEVLVDGSHLEQLLCLPVEVDKFTQDQCEHAAKYKHLAKHHE